MQALASIKWFVLSLYSISWTDTGPIAGSISLPFNPIKLIVLVAGVYICMYFVQVVQFSRLVPQRYKAVASVATLFTGPILLLVLAIADIAKKSKADRESFFEVAKHQIVSIIAKLRSLGHKAEQDDSGIRLLDSSGRSMEEIYGHGEGKREDSRILDLTEKTIANALERRASDILIDPRDESKYTIRLRIDGVLRAVNELPAETCKAVINSIKAVSGMDISERRRPQDGAFLAKKGGATSSFRVASAGALNGEKLSIRVLNKDAGVCTLYDVGFAEKQYAVIEDAIKKPSGMILICGPTGSGKTTTMYSMLNQIDRFTRNVITVEDPIEAVLEEASQIEINAKAGITFGKALRSILRQDPDVICVGEIRDEETAEIALRASQTGHLVLATIHCDSNATAIVRLLDLGVSPLLLSSGLSLVMSQRLLRKLCEQCRQPANLSETQLSQFSEKGIDTTNIYQAAGCERCEDTGYYGRTAICDLLIVTEELKADIASSKSLIEKLRGEGDKKGTSSLRKQGMKKVVSGVTSLAEIKRVVG
jgi:type II secretory ATPase GspE/PulE/Tfp pilus assembly ATPase PilB-like protein